MVDKNLYNSHDLAISIKNRAKTRKISLAKMLEDCNLGSNTMSALYHGKAMAFDSLARIADYLDCSVDYLLGRTDIPEVNRPAENTHIIKIAARNGSFKELALNDEQLDELEKYVNSLPEITDL